MADLSIIIVSHNTKELLTNTLHSVFNALSGDKSLSAEVIVVDNGSTDGSADAVAVLCNKHRNLKLHETGANLGFSKANNIGASLAVGNYLLFLNSDTVVNSLKAGELIRYLDDHPKVGALGIKLVLPDGTIDPACHRGFPTIWRSFTYLSGLERISSPLPILNRLFGGYHLTHLPRTTIHEVDAISGAFFMMHRELFMKIKGFDEAFFMYGEDVDLAFRIKQAGYTVMYYPLQCITHIKGQSGMKHTDVAIKRKTSTYFFDAMNIFYRKHYAVHYPELLNKVVYRAIEFKKSKGS